VPTEQAATTEPAAAAPAAEPAVPAASDSAKVLVVGVLSDTHGHLHPRVKTLLQGVDHIIHAGDIGSQSVLEALRAIAPVTAVRGNCDTEAWARALPPRAGLELGGVDIVVQHIAGGLQVAPGRQVIITGHSHMAAMEWRAGNLHLNPGSAGPRRFGRPRTVARLVIQAAGTDRPGAQPGARFDAEILNAEDTQD
jgi:putative phosphoesterase